MCALEEQTNASLALYYALIPTFWPSEHTQCNVNRVRHAHGHTHFRVQLGREVKDHPQREG